MNSTSNESLAHNQSAADKPVIDFDLSTSMADIEKRLEEERRNRTHEFITPQRPPIAVNAPSASPPPDNAIGSGLLAELALEAAKSQDAKLSATQEVAARTQRLQEALDRICGFFTPLIQFANNMEPAISRVYRLDARTAYADLKWRGAFLDTRKQDMSSTALLAHVTFSVNYSAPAPVLVMRPWDQLEALKTELNNLKLKVMDESELDSKRPKQEWLQVKLTPDLPVHLRFLANYDKGHLDVLSRNLLTFGISSFRLQPESVTPQMLDDLGRVLLGRSDKLPTALLPL